MSGLIELQDLKKYFDAKGGKLHAVDGVNMSIPAGTTMGVVGESGCGKSTLGRMIVHLHESTGGKILFEGRDVTHLSKAETRSYREDVQMIFQDPYSSLDPRQTVYDVISEPLKLSKKFTEQERDAETLRVMDMVGIDHRTQHAYPHELDGGRRQRVGIGRALALNPKMIVCDEPVSALDVSIQAQILNFLQDLQEQHNLTYMFITHDLSVVKHISHDISVMYLGQLVETSPSKTLFQNPLHPYTKALLSAIPSTDIDNPMKRDIIKGELSSPIDPEPGCRFASRCPFATAKCRENVSLREIEKNHFVACCRVEEIN